MSQRLLWRSTATSLFRRQEPGKESREGEQMNLRQNRVTESISQSNCHLHDKVIYVDSERRQERERDRVIVRRRPRVTQRNTGKRMSCSQCSGQSMDQLSTVARKTQHRLQPRTMDATASADVRVSLPQPSSCIKPDDGVSSPHPQEEEAGANSRSGTDHSPCGDVCDREDRAAAVAADGVDVLVAGRDAAPSTSDHDCRASEADEETLGERDSQAHRLPLTRALLGPRTHSLC